MESIGFKRQLKAFFRNGGTFDSAITALGYSAPALTACLKHMVKHGHLSQDGDYYLTQE